MPILKSLFNNGAGKTASETAFQFNTSNGVLLTGASNLLALGAAGFSLSGHTFLSPALASASAYIALNDEVASRGYVDQAVAGVTPGIPGDATYIDFAVASAVSFTAGDIMALSPTSGLVLADANDAEVERSNAIGVFLLKPTTTTARVQVDGQVEVGDLSAYDKGDLVWVSATAGELTSYPALPSGAYATQVGIVSDDANPGKILLQPRIFGEVA